MLVITWSAVANFYTFFVNFFKPLEEVDELFYNNRFCALKAFKMRYETNFRNINMNYTPPIYTICGARQWDSSNVFTT